jgi:signal transduction histidine kinase/PAS domain-containing protein
MTAKTVIHLKKILAPPVFADEEKTRVAGLLNTVFLVALPIVLFYSAIIPFVYTRPALIIILPVVGVQICLTFFGLFLIRRGYIRFTALLLAASYWLSVTIAAYLGGGVNGPVFSAYILAIVFAGVILDTRAIILFAGFTLLSGILLFYLNANDWLPAMLTPDPAGVWLTQSVQIILTALLLYLFAGSLRDALARVRANERAMVEVNDALQQEISKRVRAQVEQERSLSLLQATLESTADGILVVNKAGEITSFNQKFVEMWRIPESLIADRDDKATLNFVMGQLKDPDSFLANVRHLYEQEEGESFDVLEFKDGRIYERYSRPQRIGAEIAGRVWSFRDVTEQKQAEAALRQYTRRLETLQSVTAALSTSLALDELLDIILEQLAVVLPFDSATIFLLEPDSLLAVAGRGLPHPEQVIGHKFSLDNDLYRLMSQPKESVWLADAQADPRFERWGDADYIRGWLCVPLLAHGKLIGFMTVDSRQPGVYGPEQAALVQPFAGQAAQAIENARLHEQVRQHAAELEARVAERTHELREAQERLLRREKLAMMGQLAGGIAHELRNPLGAIKNAAYALNLLQEKANPEVTEMLRVLRVEVDTAERIIKTLLDYARSRMPHCELVDVNEIMQAVIGDTAVPPHIRIITQLDDTLPLVPADPGQLTQIFTNIIQNSLQAMSGQPLPEKDCQLTIQTARANPDWITISFADTGGGIPAENLDKLFEPLFTTKARGIGLGLALVKTFVEGHGGSIAVSSREGQGATFTIRLPLAFPSSAGGRSSPAN